MRLIALILSLTLCGGAAVGAPPAPPDWRQPEVAYSATRVEHVMGIERRATVYYDHGKERSEELIQGVLYVSLYLPQDRAHYVYSPGDGTASMSCLDFAELRKGANLTEAQALGREKLQGEEVTRYRVVNRDGGRDYTTFMWSTDDGIVMRSSDERGGFGFELRDLERGPQQSKLFDLPEGIQIIPASWSCKND